MLPLGVPTIARDSVSIQAVSGKAATSVWPIGVSAVVSTEISTQFTFIDIYFNKMKKHFLNI